MRIAESQLLVGDKAAVHMSTELGEVKVTALLGRDRKTTTPERGKQIATCAEVSDRLGGVQFYFCHPHLPMTEAHG